MPPLLDGHPLGASLSLLPADQWAPLLGSTAPLAATCIDLALLAEPVPALLAALLAAGEQERFQSFRYPKRRQEWLGGRIAAKAALALVLAATGSRPPPPAALVIASDSGGKPFPELPGHGPRFHLSISHSHGRAAALAGGHPCGIDLQRITPTVVRVKERFALPAEERVLAESLGGQEEAVRLTLLWAAKEALRKMMPSPPLPGFLDLALAAIEPAGQGHLFLFPSPQICHNATRPLRVVTATMGSSALAATLLPPTE